MSERMNPQSSPQTAPLVFKTGGMVMLVGIWFLLIGLALGGGSIAMAVLAPGDSGSMWFRVALFVFAVIPLAAAVFGLLLTFGGEHITLDRSAREVRIRYGRWWTWKRETRPLSEFHAVELHRQSTTISSRRDSSGRPSHPVRLLSTGDEIELANVGDYRKARTIAEEVANYTGLPLHEATERQTVVREAGTLDESIADRARRLGEEVKWSNPPGDSRIELRHEGDTTLILLPRPDRKLTMEGLLGIGFLLLIYGGGLAGAAYFIGNWLDKAGIDAGTGIWPAVIWSLPIIPAVLILLFGAALLIGRECVAVSPRMFKRTWQFPFGGWTRKIPAGEIEELLGDTDDVILRTDRTTCRVGFVLNKKERRWLATAIRYLLVKGPPPVQIERRSNDQKSDLHT